MQNVHLVHRQIDQIAQEYSDARGVYLWVIAQKTL